MAQNDQLSLFQTDSSVDTLDVVIDAQIFFDLIPAERNQEEVSKALLSDFLAETISLRVTDELLVEIDRSQNSTQREAARNGALNFPTVVHDIETFRSVESTLKNILPTDTPRALSDVRQLAKTASSGVMYFVTRDNRLLREARKIADLTGLDVLSPSELIVRFHELLGAQAYLPELVSGPSIRWRRLGSADLNTLPYEAFLVQEEGKGEFKGRLEHYLADPSKHECELLWSSNEVAAIRICERNTDQSALIVHLARGSNSSQRSLFEQFLVSDSVIKAVTDGIEKVEIADKKVFPRLESDLLAIGFIKVDGRFVRLCYSRELTRKEVLARSLEIAPESHCLLDSLSDSDLQRSCSPLSLSSEEDCFLIPIRPGFALSLVDQRQAANDLFGGNTNVLLRWDNVYYRRNTHHQMLRSPARLLWYVSAVPQRQGQIVAISHLDSVEIDTPRELFRKYKNLGVLDWNQIYEMCGGDADTEIMALKFSHTFPFRQPILLEDLRKVFEEDGFNLVLQSPSRITPTTFKKLFEIGFSW